MLFRMTGFLKDGIFIAFYGNKGKEENRMKRTKENAGITLIALVITIIVLLILAGISI